jgi:hypothetical protein
LKLTGDEALQIAEVAVHVAAFLVLEVRLILRQELFTIVEREGAE